MLPICRVSNKQGENLYTKTLTYFRMYKSRRLNLSNGNYHQSWGVYGLVRMVVIKVHIDEYSRKRVLKIVKEKRTYKTTKYLKKLERRKGFPTHMIQVDNGREFVNDGEETERESAFEKAAKALNMKLRRTRPYSPWQNGKVERSHREDGKILHSRKIFTSEKELIKQVSKLEVRYNKTAKTSLKFKNPNQVVSGYFSKCNICLDN